MGNTPLDLWMGRIVQRSKAYMSRRFRKRYGRDVLFEWVPETGDDPMSPYLRASENVADGVVFYEGLDEAAVAGLFLTPHTGNEEAQRWAARAWGQFISKVDAQIAFLERLDAKLSSSEPGDDAPASSGETARTSPSSSAAPGKPEPGTTANPPRTSRSLWPSSPARPSGS